MGKMMPIAVPEELAAVLRYRKKKTGMPITKQLEQMIYSSASPSEIKDASGARKNEGDA